MMLSIIMLNVMKLTVMVLLINPSLQKASVFVKVSHFNPILIILYKAWSANPYSEAPLLPNPKTIFENIRLGLK